MPGRRGPRVEAGTRAQHSRAHSKIARHSVPQGVVVRQARSRTMLTQSVPCAILPLGCGVGPPPRRSGPSLSRPRGHSTMRDTSHLRGLTRRSPCCHSALTHPYTDSARFAILICLSCQSEVVGDHELWNDRGERVWPVDPDAPLPSLPPRRRSRRKPVEPEPDAFTLHLPPRLRRF